MRSAQERFEEKIERITESGCHIWMAGCNSVGYGRFYLDGKLESAHRVSYEFYIKPIPSNLLVLHRCDNPCCVNPHHLFLGTHTDNTKDMCVKGRHKEQKKTHCLRGHGFTEENTYIDPRGDRRCRTCSKESLRKWALKKARKA